MHLSSSFSRRIDITNPPPGYGDYLEIYFSDDNGRAVEERYATHCEIHEFTREGELLSHVYGTCSNLKYFTLLRRFVYVISTIQKRKNV